MQSNFGGRGRLRSSPATALALVMLAAPSVAHAQDQASTAADPARGASLSEIVVTAERRTGNLQRTAASVSVRGGAELVQQGKFSIETLLENVPGVTAVAPRAAAASGSDTPSTEITIRGIATNSTSNGGVVSIVPATAIYVDEIYSGIGGNYDLDRLEVLRGPQGTLYGRSATAGVVALHTHAPNLAKPEIYASAEVGDYGLRHYTVAGGVPIIDGKLAVRAAFNQYQRDGYSADTAGAINTTEGRIKALLVPADGVSIELGAAFQDNNVKTGGVENRLVTPDTYSLIPNTSIGQGRNTFEQYWLKANFDLGFGQIKYIGTYRSWEQNALNSQIGPGGNFLDQRIQLPKDNFLTQELRLSSDASSPLKWQVGVYYYNNDLTAVNDIRYNLSGALLDTNSTQRKTTDVGLFAEATVPLSDVFRITGGIRYDHTRVESTQTDILNVNLAAGTGATAGLPEALLTTVIDGDAGVSVFKNVTYKARAEYDLSPRNLLYASISSGFLPGDVQITSGVVTKFSAETLTAYEVGSKNRFIGNRLQVNLGAFYYDYSGYQALITANPSNPSSGKIFNLPLRVWGAEFEAILALSSNDRLALNGLILGSKIHNAPSGFSQYSVKDTIWGSPRETLSGSYSHTFDFGDGSKTVATAEANYRGRYDVSAYSPLVASVGGDKYFSQKPVVLANANLTWSSPGNTFSITGYVRNIFDNRYKSNVIPIINGSGPPFSLGSVSTELSPPRTYGVVMTMGI